VSGSYVFRDDDLEFWPVGIFLKQRVRGLGFYCWDKLPAFTWSAVTDSSSAAEAADPSYTVKAPDARVIFKKIPRSEVFLKKLKLF
jgi:hypothetical protein